MSKNSYRLVEQEVEQLERRIRRHRWKVAGIICLVIVLAFAALFAMDYISKRKSYTEYEVLESIERKDSVGTKFAEFCGNIVKYSNDGAVCIDAKNRQIWNQTYEMQDPILDFCEEYVAIADRNGKQIYVMNAEKTWGFIETTMPIQQIHVANQGTVAVLLERDGVGYIQLYDKKGTFLAEGALHAENSGYPLDIAISNDGKKMMVSMLDVSDGQLNSTITFYNFGTVGQNEVDNIVCSYAYPGVIIPKVEFLTNDIAVGLGENCLILYEGTQKPVVNETISLNREVQSVCYNEEHIGLVYDSEETVSGHEMEVYDVEGAKVLNLNLPIEYEKVEFLNSGELYIGDELQCVIYTMDGIKRFQGSFEKDVHQVIHVNGRQYVLVMAGATEIIKLK